MDLFHANTQIVHTELLHKVLIDGLKTCSLLVDYFDGFISCSYYHSDGTHSLQRIQWWACSWKKNISLYVKICSYIMQNDIGSNPNEGYADVHLCQLGI